jgi:hypothetical protein
MLLLALLLVLLLLHMLLCVRTIALLFFLVWLLLLLPEGAGSHRCITLVQEVQIPSELQHLLLLPSLPALQLPLPLLQLQLLLLQALLLQPLLLLLQCTASPTTPLSLCGRLHLL